MRALLWCGKGDVRVGETNKPRIEAPTDALVRVTAMTLCGSDLHLYWNEIPQMKRQDVMGHEFMGEVVEVGSAVRRIRTGARVVNSFNISCGECDFCKREGFFFFPEAFF